MIHKVSDKLYCVNINKPVIKDTSMKINHICLVDNENITDASIMKSIMNNYPQMLKLYGTNYVTFTEVQLITTWPKLKTVKINDTNVYTEFNKIPIISHSTKSLESSTLEYCNKLINPETINEIIIFTNYVDGESNRIKLLLSMMNNDILSIVTYETTQLNTFTLYKLTKGNEYEKLIKSHKLLYYKNIPYNTITTESKIFGLNSNTITIPDCYNFIPITSNDKTIIINNISYELTFSEELLNDDNLLDSFECVVKYCGDIDDTFNDFKNILLINYDLTKDNKNRKMALYYNYKTKYLEYVNKYIDSLDVNDDNIKSIIDYGKKTCAIDTYTNENIQKPNFKIIDINDINFEDDVNFNNSLEVFVSSITLSNWYDEVTEKSALGILFNFTTTELTHFGVSGFSNIDNLTCTFMSITDFINNAKEYFEISNRTFGDLNNSTIVKVNSTNTANAILPIYINKHHWQIAKVYLNSLLGIINAHNPFIQSKSHINIYYDVFMHMTKMLFQKQNINEKYIQVYFSFFRTCSEICFENRFNFGIKTLVNNFMTNDSYRHFKNKMEHNKIFTQILTTGFVINDIKLFLQYLLEESIRVCIKNRKYRYKYLDELKTFTDNDFDKELKILLENICGFISSDIKEFIGFYKMYNIFRIIIEKSKSYNQFIKQFDKSYNVLPSELVNIVLNNVDVMCDPVSFKYFYNVLCIDYDENKVIMYILQSIYEYKIKSFEGHIDIRNTDVSREYIIDYVNNKLLKCK